MVSDTSINIYSELKEYLGDCQLEVLRYIRKYPHCSRKEISIGLNIPINNVCGRVKELIRFDLVKEGNKKVCTITKNNVNSVYATTNIDYSLLKLKKHSKKDIIKLEKKHISTINKLLSLLVKKVANTPLDKLKDDRNKGFIDGIMNLQTDLRYIMEREMDLEPFLYNCDPCYMLFKVCSESRELFFDVEYNRINNKFVCNCEDFVYNKKGLKQCKHIERVIKKFKLENGLKEIK